MARLTAAKPIATKPGAVPSAAPKSATKTSPKAGRGAASGAQATVIALGKDAETFAEAAAGRQWEREPKDRILA